MAILSRIATVLRGNDCEKLVTRTVNDFKFSGGVGAGPINVNIAELSKTFKQLIQSSDIAVSLDDSQYQLCKAISDMKEEDTLKEDCKRIRLQLVLGINQLRSILGTLKEQPDDTQKRTRQVD